MPAVALFAFVLVVALAVLNFPGPSVKVLRARGSFTCALWPLPGKEPVHNSRGLALLGAQTTLHVRSVYDRGASR